MKHAVLAALAVLTSGCVHASAGGGFAVPRGDTGDGGLHGYGAVGVNSGSQGRVRFGGGAGVALVGAGDVSAYGAGPEVRALVPVVTLPRDRRISIAARGMLGWAGAIYDGVPVSSAFSGLLGVAYDDLGPTRDTSTGRQATPYAYAISLGFTALRLGREDDDAIWLLGLSLELTPFLDLDYLSGRSD
jgi:hypothetical protein